ncbi:hypothetical protein C8R48DRAFT_704359 [Suillus tomentosus]|nr:hypothetical protein C8R48DRAFT_704359 [Suillus tomentosus]
MFLRTMTPQPDSNPLEPWSSFLNSITLAWSLCQPLADSSEQVEYLLDVSFVNNIQADTYLNYRILRSKVHICAITAGFLVVLCVRQQYRRVFVMSAASATISFTGVYWNPTHDKQ